MLGQIVRPVDAAGCYVPGGRGGETPLILDRAMSFSLDFAAGDESLEVKLFHEAEIPWSELAFPTIGRTLECYFADRVSQHFPVRNEPLAALHAHHKKA